MLAIVALSAALGWALDPPEGVAGDHGRVGHRPGRGLGDDADVGGAFGADARLVAFMQYLRVVMVAAIATAIVARLWVGPSGATVADAGLVRRGPLAWAWSRPWQSPASCGVIGHLLRIPAGGAAGADAHRRRVRGDGPAPVSRCRRGCWRSAMHSWAGASASASRARSWCMPFAGIAAGAAGDLRDHRVLRPARLDSCARGRHRPAHGLSGDEPGGMDSVAIIAASSNVDLSFVMALQTVRLAVVLIVGPPLARFISQRMT